MKNILKESIIELELEEDLRKQLNVSFLNEEQGIFPNAKEMTDKLCSYCINYITDTSNVAEYNDRFYIYDINLPENFFGDNTFFKEIKCFIKIYLFKDSFDVLSSEDSEKFRQTLKNNYDPRLYNVEDNKFEMVVVNLGCVVRNKEDLRAQLSREFMHEMTHAYENLQRILKSGGHGLLDYALKSQYGRKLSLMFNRFDQLTDEENDLLNDIFYSLYFISKPEINARLSEFYSEIRSNRLDNINQASNIIYKTNTWKEIKDAYKIIDSLEYAFNFDEKNILYIINKLSKKKYRNYETFVKELKNKFLLIKNELFKKMAKLVYRVKMEQEEFDEPMLTRNLLRNNER